MLPLYGNIKKGGICIKKNLLWNLFIYICIILAILTISIRLYGKSKKDLTLNDIAYDVDEKYGYTVYLKEKFEYVPYLVITNDYYGNALLLRRDILENDLIYNDESKNYTSYYNDSYIDRFLNNEFITYLDSEISNNIINSKLIISAKDNLDKFGVKTENINRKIFILSCSEVGLSSKYSIPDEGENLKYFNESGRKIAYKNSSQWCWWLRTPYISRGSNSMAWIIFQDGMAEGNSINGFFPKGGVRPAFCLKNNTKIIESEELIDGKKIFVICN